MQEHTMVLGEKEFRLFQTIREIQVGPEEREVLIENLIQEIECFISSNEKQRIITEQFQEAEGSYKEYPEMIVSERNASAEWGDDLLSPQMSSNAYKEWLQTENDIYDDLFKDDIT